MTSKWAWLEALTFAREAPNGAVRTGYALAAYADSATGQNAFPSQATLAERLGITDRAVRKSLAWLKDAGWIVEVRRGRRAGTQGITSSYSLTIPTGTNVPIGESPTGMNVPHGDFPTGTFDTSQAELLGSPTGTDVPPNQGLTNQEPKAENASGFQEFISAYPKHQGQRDARDAYLTARTKIGQAELVAAVKRFAATVEDRNSDAYRKCLGPVRWLSEEKWLEYPEPRKSPWVEYAEKGQQTEHDRQQFDLPPNPRGWGQGLPELEEVNP
ncbi:MAG: helix-turn-helix domain-containing protein [Paenarthrobacter ureafaciens]|uniref:helix-turn-helix domain-containing protein n=1 Tax=Paenarthrobacter ureafaciens TaxID=37931 RepID=UPI001AD2A639|nr:helix-turn-helix domain-containing protein [Paenarthrobacter ureafaciens]MBN9128503.1 helix-turn-helix domain-containing protein [Paenarthrobacter ureafaciens]